VDLMAAPVEELFTGRKIPARVISTVKWLGCKTIGDMVAIPPSKWLSQPNAGPMTLTTIKDLLARQGARLVDDPPRPPSAKSIRCPCCGAKFGLIEEASS
jgi:hypothetical protein